MSDATTLAETLTAISAHRAQLLQCTACPRMIRPVVSGAAVVSPVYMVGQAPGPHEGRFGKPFAWTAGKRLFSWYGSIGVDEATFRERAYIAAVCRCFPGKNPQGGGDRVPEDTEIAACSAWMRREIELLRPTLIIAVGRLAISRFLPAAPLAELVGPLHRVTAFGHQADLIALPHPSGASTWFKMEPGITLLAQALATLGAQPAWQALKR